MSFVCHRMLPLLYPMYPIWGTFPGGEDAASSIFIMEFKTKAFHAEGSHSTNISYCDQAVGSLSHRC